MTSFVTAFSSSDYEVPASKHQQEINSFSNIDLDQQATPTHEPSSPIHGIETHSSLTPAAALHGRASWSSMKFFGFYATNSLCVSFQVNLRHRRRQSIGEYPCRMLRDYRHHLWQQ